MFQFRCYDNMTNCEKYLNPVQLLKCTHAKSVCIVFDHQQCAAVRINLLLTKVPPQWASDCPSHCSNSKRDKIPKKKKTHFARKVAQRAVYGIFFIPRKLRAFWTQKASSLTLLKEMFYFRVTRPFRLWPIVFLSDLFLFSKFPNFLNIFFLICFIFIIM